MAIPEAAEEAEGTTEEVVEAETSQRRDPDKQRNKLKQKRRPKQKKT